MNADDQEQLREEFFELCECKKLSDLLARVAVATGADPEVLGQVAYYAGSSRSQSPARREIFLSGALRWLDRCNPPPQLREEAQAIFEKL